MTPQYQVIYVIFITNAQRFSVYFTLAFAEKI